MSVSTALSVTDDTAQVSGGAHGSTVCTSSPDGYCSVALPIPTRGGARRSDDIDLGAVQANETAPITGLDIELISFGLAHWRQCVDQAAGVSDATTAASGVGVTRRGEALAGVVRGVNGNIELVGEGR